MSYREIKRNGWTKIRLTCDARKGKRVCGNEAEVMSWTREGCGEILSLLGWGLLRGHQVCSSCIAKGAKNVHFPQKVAV